MSLIFSHYWWLYIKIMVPFGLSSKTVNLQIWNFILETVDTFYLKFFLNTVFPFSKFCHYITSAFCTFQIHYFYQILLMRRWIGVIQVISWWENLYYSRCLMDFVYAFLTRLFLRYLTPTRVINFSTTCP